MEGNFYLIKTAITAFDAQIKFYGYDHILKPLLHDLKLLETEGIVIKYKNEDILLRGNYY